MPVSKQCLPNATITTLTGCVASSDCTWMLRNPEEEIDEQGGDLGVIIPLSERLGNTTSILLSDEGDHENAMIGMSMDELNEKGFAPIVPNTMFKHPQEENKNTVAMDCGMSSLVLDVSKLPPLKEPQYKQRRQETNVGISVVLTMALLCIGVTHGVSLAAVGGIQKHSTVWWTFFVAVYAETGVALVLLAALLCSDPGVVLRSEANCFPIPLQCEDWIRSYMEGRIQEVQPPQEHYIASSDPDKIGDSYCMRCLVWRRHQASNSYFHCNICQRCVIHFDHHCSVFGRCIGGKRWRGNYKFFVGLIATGAAGCLTTVVCVLWSVSLRYKPLIAIPIAVVLLWFTSGLLMGRHCIGTCNTCRNLAVGCINAVRRGLNL